jgi:hypothetical protein
VASNTRTVASEGAPATRNGSREGKRTFNWEALDE